MGGHGVSNAWAGDTRDGENRATGRKGEQRKRKRKGKRAGEKSNHQNQK